MAEPRGDGRRGPHDKTSHNIEIHRMNDFLLGHVGQLSYKNVDDEDADIGSLGSSRKSEQLLSFHQVLPCEEWFAPTRTGLIAPSSRTFQHIKSQKYWLLKTHPEAYLSNADTPNLLSEQLRATRVFDSGEGNQTASALAVGEITDLRNPSHHGSWPVVAVAAGEAAHILRISSMSLQNCTFGKHSVPVGYNTSLAPVAADAAQSNFQGFWCSDGTAISQIKFATKSKQHDPFRWLIVQKRSSTTIFEPEIRSKPVENTASMLSLDVGGEEHIAANPIVTLTTDATGGDTHCDFSMNLGADEDAPQLAIIDRSGNWSVWYIERERFDSTRRMTTKAVLKNKGSWNLPLSPDLANGLQSSEQKFRINWTAKTKGSDDWGSDSNSSDDGRVHTNALHTTYLAGLSTTSSRFEKLLISNNTQLQFLDAISGTSLSWLSFNRREDTHVLLDAQLFPECPAHIFVLTTEKLYLLHASDTEHQEASRLAVLVSCPHFMCQGKGVLKMSVTKLHTSHDRATSLVSLYSTQKSRVRAFYFTIAFQDGNVDFHHQVVDLPGPKVSSAGFPQGIECLTAVPLQVSASKKKKRGGSGADTNQTFETNQVQFYQVFQLAADLSLNSSITAVFSGPAEKLTQPVRSAMMGWDEARRVAFLRKKLLREGENAFVVPDVVGQDKQLGSMAIPLEHVVKHDALPLRYYLVRLVEEINRGFFGTPAAGFTKNSTVDPFSLLRDISNDRKADDHVALKPISEFTQFWQHLDLAEVDNRWDGQLRRLQEYTNVQLFECGQYGSKLSAMDLFELFSVNWSARLPAESLRAKQWRYIELALERMAVEVYLSEKGVYMVPPSTKELASKALPERKSRVAVKDENEDLPLPQSRSDLALPTPSTTPTSSRAVSEAIDGSQRSQEDDDLDQEDPAVTRLRMYLPSIKFTPPAKRGQSRVISLWPEQRGSDPAEYKYSPTGKPDAESQAAQRRREREEERRRRRAEKRAQIGIKMERAGEAFSQPLMPRNVTWSSPPPQVFAQSQAPVKSFGFESQQSQAHSQSQSQSQGFGFSQIMSQPLPGEFGARRSKVKKKAKVKTPIYFK